MKLASKLFELDPPRGRAPWRCAPTRPERVLHVHLATADEPQLALCRALQSLAEPGGSARVDWTALPTLQQRHEAVLAAAGQLRPSLVFMQLQRPDVLQPRTVAQLRQASGRGDAVIVSWCGDVGGVNGPDHEQGEAWAHEMAQACDLMLYSSLSQVRALRSRGMLNAAYLQIGYDENRYFEGPQAEYGADHDVVFAGARHRAAAWHSLSCQEADLRDAAVQALCSSAGLRMGLYGSGWSVGTPVLAPADSGQAYRRSHLALSVSLTSRLERYTSDRLFRALACGTPVLLKSFADDAALGLRDGENCLLWNQPDEAAALARHWLAPQRRAALRQIGRSGAALAREHHGWGLRMQELAPLLAAVRGELPVLARPW